MSGNSSFASIAGLPDLHEQIHDLETKLADKDLEIVRLRARLRVYEPEAKRRQLAVVTTATSADTLVAHAPGGSRYHLAHCFLLPMDSIWNVRLSALLKHRPKCLPCTVCNPPMPDSDASDSSDAKHELSLFDADDVQHWMAKRQQQQLSPSCRYTSA